MNGTYTPRTLPVGGEEAREVSPRSLAEALLVSSCIFMVTVEVYAEIAPLMVTVGVR